MGLQELKEKYSHYGTFAKNSAILFMGGLVVNILNYVFHLVIGRQVSVPVYGEAESLLALITIASVPAATLSMVATKYAAACKADGNQNGSWEIFAYLNKKVLKFGLPIFVLMVLMTPLVGKFLHIDKYFALILIWVSMYISFFNSVNSGLLSGWQKFKQMSLSSVLVAIVKLIFGVALVSFGFALGGIVGSLVLSTIAGYVITFLFLKSSVMKKSENKESRRESTVDFASLKRFVMPVFIGSLAINILGNADMILAKHNLSDLVAGQYGALSVTAKVIFFATGVIAGVLFSMSSESNHKGGSSFQILKIALFLVLGASLFATAIYFLYPVWVLSILFGSKYHEVAPYLGWFAIAVTLFSVSNVIFQYLLSIHKTKISYAFLAIALATLVAFTIGGKTVYAMLAINIVAQLSAILVGIFFLFREKSSLNRKPIGSTGNTIQDLPI